MSDLYENFKKLFKEKLNVVKDMDEGLVWPLNTWIGNHKINLNLFLDIQEGILNGVPNSILLKEMFLRVNKRVKHVKYPKKVEKEDRELDWLMDYFKQFYNWSKREVKLYYSTIKIYLNDEKFKCIMARKFGLNNKERKKLGLEEINFEEKHLHDNQRRLF